MKTFIYNNGGYILFATAITVVIIWRVFFPNLQWK